MTALNEAECAAEIDAIFQAIADLTPMQIAHALDATKGKLYELYCAGRLMGNLLASHGWSPTFTGGPLILKASGGFANTSDPHFELYDGQLALVGRLYTDVEVLSLGVEIGVSEGLPVSDLSAYHEIDIVVLKPTHDARPTPEQLIIGMECKAVAEFKKSFVREVLGRRRELSYLDWDIGLDGPIRAHPPSIYYLAYIDQAGDRYKQSPALFGVLLEHWEP